MNQFAHNQNDKSTDLYFLDCISGHKCRGHCTDAFLESTWVGDKKCIMDLTFNAVLWGIFTYQYIPHFYIPFQQDSNKWARL